MDNLIFSLNATVPIFLMMVLGVFFRKVGLLRRDLVDGMNQFVFKAALPVLLFEDLSGSDFFQVWDGGFVLFCFAATLVGIGLSALCSLLLRDHAERGEFIQSSYRSSAALLGIAFIKNIYGEPGMAPLMIIGSVPLYNVMAVTVLAVTRPDQKRSGGLMKDTLIGIATNPIILGIFVGLIWSLLRIPQPSILQKTVANLSAVATPLGLMAMGASFDFKKAGAGVKAALGASAIKLVGLCALCLPAAVALGFRREELVAILVMLGSATTVSCYVMARNMGHEGVLSASVVALTTCGSAFTLTFWLYVLRSLGLI